jgi:hypothetical protein
MLAIAVGAEGGEYSVTVHTAVERCRHESMLVRERSQEESGGEVWRKVDRLDRYLEAREEGTFFVFTFEVMSNSSLV